jgi:homocysteine S-methyltransferase
METIMARYRHSLPQFNGGTFLSDGGMETDLIFNRGVDLPLFASFPIIETEAGRKHLADYYDGFLALARDRGAGFILDSATWRSSPGWGAQLGYDAAALDRVNRAAIDLIVEVRARWDDAVSPIVLNGAIGPRGDGYKAGRMEAAEAQDYHTAQIASFAATEADMVSAITMNTINEAVGIARAARAANMPCVVSFTVETDGKLVGGQSLKEAIETTEEMTGSSPAYYMVNCAHPSHFDHALATGEGWAKRILGVRANASAKSHQELDESTVIDIGDPLDLARRYQALPKLRIYGGCCGTDHRHIAAICDAVMPPMAKSA